MAQNEFQTLLQFFKVLADENRLKLLGLLAGGERSVEELAALLQLRAPTISHHLAKLKELNLVTMRPVGNTHYYSLNAEALRETNKQLLTPEKMASMVVDLEGDSWERKVLTDFFDGMRLKEIPASRKKRLVILKWLANQFEYGVLYKEAQVNEELRRYHEDASTLRRELVSSKEAFMQREDGYYWRIPKGENWRSVIIRSADRQPLQIWIGIPEDAEEDDQFPAVIELHESPFYKPSAQSEWISPLAPMWVKRGYVYVAINYPPPLPESYALSFQERIAGNPGKWELEDLLSVRTWLLKQNDLVDPMGIFLTGWGYSASMILLAMLKQDGSLWSGAIVGQPVMDWAQEYYWSEDKKALRALFQGTPEEKQESYKMSSPSNTLPADSIGSIGILQSVDAQIDYKLQVERFMSQIKEDAAYSRVWKFIGSHADPEVEQIVEAGIFLLDAPETLSPER